jgi:competence protein ComFC
MWRYIVDIFVEDVWRSFSDQDIQIWDLTEHYHVDFPKLALDAVFTWSRYSDIEDILESYKYHSERAHAFFFSRILREILQRQDITDAIIVTVPMHWSRYTLRWFDHMDYLMKILSRDTDIQYIQPLSTSFSRRQSKLSRKKRLENRKNHFTIDNSIVLPRRVFLIDDVISTGATAHECAKLLKIHGVEEVIGIFVASSAEASSIRIH